MKTSIAIGAILAASAVPTPAQRMGHANTNAPTVEQAITLGDRGRVELSYTSITWSAGRWAAALQNEETRAQMRDTINQTAEQEPLGTFTASADVTVGKETIPAGTYHLAFTLDEEYRWQLVLSMEGERKVLPVELGENPLKSERLVLALLAGDEDFTARLFLAFGAHAGDLPISVDPASGQAIYTCPMHPEVRTADQGKCPICGMDLIKG